MTTRYRTGPGATAAAADGHGQVPSHIQASREIVIQFRGDLLDQAYLISFEKPGAVANL